MRESNEEAKIQNFEFKKEEDNKSLEESFSLSLEKKHGNMDMPMPMPMEQPKEALEIHNENMIVLDKKRNEVKKNIPVNRPKHPLKREKQPMPKELLGLLDVVLDWEKVKKETSIPVKNAAEKLKDAENDDDAAAAMAELVGACTHYLDVNSGNIFKSGDRKDAVRGILKAVSEFMVDARGAYILAVDEKIKSQREDAASDHMETFAQNTSRIVEEKTGHDWIFSLGRERSAVEANRSTLSQKWGSYTEAAADILEKRKEAKPDERIAEKKVEDFIKTVSELKIPDINKMDNFELVTSLNIERLKNEVYPGLVKKGNEVIGGGEITDYNTIYMIKTRLEAVRIALEIYDARLNIMAETEDAPESLEKLPGYNKNTEQILEKAKEHIDKRSNRNIEEFKKKYKEEHKKNPSQKLIDEERKAFEVRVSQMRLKGEYLPREKETLKKREAEKLAKKHGISKNEKLSAETILRIDHAKALNVNMNKTIDAKVNMRMGLDINIKKQVDHYTLTKLSDVAYLFGGTEKLAELVNSYAGHKTADEKIGYETIDIMSKELLFIDENKYDLSSDEKIAANAAELEKLSRAVEMYKKIVAEDPDYLDHLAAQIFSVEGLSDDMVKKYGSLDGKNMSGLLMGKLNKLDAIAKYYRIRQLVMEDEDYIYNTKEPIEGDDLQMKRLRTLIKASNSYAGKLKDDAPEGMLSKEAFLELNKDAKELGILEQQRYQVAPRWLKNAFSITDLKEYNEDKNAVFCLKLGSQENVDDYVGKYMPKELGEDDTVNTVMEERKKCKDGAFGPSPTFTGGEAYLGSIEIGDNFDRMINSFVGGLSYRRTSTELKEMINLLCIQKRPEWENIKNDPQAVKYYESAFKEMTMKLIDSAHSCQKRIIDNLGLKALIMHPMDLVTQMTPRVYRELNSAHVVTNINMFDNAPLVQKLFDDNNKDGRYLYDHEDFMDYSAVVGNVGQKINSFADQFTSAMMRNGDMDMDYPGFVKNVLKSNKYGGSDFFQKVESEYIEAKNNGDVNAQRYGSHIWYLSKHNEYYSKKNFMVKDDEGNFTFGEHIMNSNFTLYTPDSITGYYNLMNKGKVSMLPQKDVDDYEKHMKKQKYPKMFTNNHRDPYGIKLYKNKMKPLVEHENDKPIMGKKGAYKTKDATEY